MRTVYAYPEGLVAATMAFTVFGWNSFVVFDATPPQPPTNCRTGSVHSHLAHQTLLPGPTAFGEIASAFGACTGLSRSQMPGMTPGSMLTARDRAWPADAVLPPKVAAILSGGTNGD